MFLGHFGLALAAKSRAPETSLGTLVFAAQFLDLLWPTLLLTGVEQVRIAPGDTTVTPLAFEHYPVSHSLLGASGWALLIAAACRWASGSMRVAVVAGALVLSHWLLDLVVHRPDLPLAFGDSARLGFGLWQSLPATLGIELILLSGGLWIYTRSTEAKDRVGSRALTAWVAFLLLVYAANLLGPPPPSATAIAWAGQAQWLLVSWAWWLDRHRVSSSPTRSSPRSGTDPVDRPDRHAASGH